jgi:hypothetical protein
MVLWPLIFAGYGVVHIAAPRCTEHERDCGSAAPPLIDRSLLTLLRLRERLGSELLGPGTKLPTALDGQRPALAPEGLVRLVLLALRVLEAGPVTATTSGFAGCHLTATSGADGLAPGTRASTVSGLQEGGKRVNGRRTTRSAISEKWRSRFVFAPRVGAGKPEGYACTPRRPSEGCTRTHPLPAKPSWKLSPEPRPTSVLA